MNKKRYFIPLLLVPIFSVSTLTSCNWFESTEEVKEIKRQQANNMQYISERTFSLKFTDGSKFLLGTGWIFAKENDTNTPDDYYDDIYYIATNLHVAAAIQNRNTNFYSSDSQGKYIKSETSETNYDKLYLGNVSIDGGNKLGTSYTLEENTNTYYNSYFNLDEKSNYLGNDNVDYSAVSIAYTPINTFSTMGITDEAAVYHSGIIENGTMDLAILRIDFNQIQNRNTLVKQTLDAYNKNPTKFNMTYQDKESLTIAGFPLINENGKNSGKWSAIYNATWYKPEYESTNTTTGYKKSINTLKENGWSDGILDHSDYEDMTRVKPNYIIKDHIGFSFNDYASYRNIAKQALFKNVLLTGGSSGSMAINSNNEVVGIYWGSYSNNSLIKEKNIGAVDLFYNDKEIQKAQLDSRIVLKPYNIFDNFISYFPNTNLANNIVK